jgi:hypothetical protein
MPDSRLFYELLSCGSVSFGSLYIDVAIRNSTGTMPSVVSNMLSGSVFHIFGYSSVPQPVNRSSAQTFCVLTKTIGPHPLCSRVEAFLHNASDLARAAYSTFTTRLVN